MFIQPKFYGSKKLILFAVLAILMTSEMATDIYVPSLPQLATEFGTTEHAIGLSLSLHFYAIALSGLIWGTLTDYLGRRRIMIFGAWIFSLGTLLCLGASTLWGFLGARFIQGIGSGAPVALSLVVIKDLYKGASGAKIIARVGMAIAFAPLVAPVLGGYLASVGSWTLGFKFLFGFSVVAAVLTMLFLSETLKTPRKLDHKSFRREITSAWKEVLSQKAFLQMTAIPVLFCGHFFFEATALPFVYARLYGQSAAEIGYFFGFSVFIYMLGGLYNQYALDRVGAYSLMKTGVLLHILSCTLIVLALSLGYSSPYVIHGLKAFGSFGMAFVFGNSGHLALELCPRRMGEASSFLSFAQTTVGALISWLFMLVYGGDPAILYTLSFGLGILALYFVYALSPISEQFEPAKAPSGS